MTPRRTRMNDPRPTRSPGSSEQVAMFPQSCSTPCTRDPSYSGRPSRRKIRTLLSSSFSGRAGGQGQPRSRLVFLGGILWSLSCCCWLYSSSNGLGVEALGPPKDPDNLYALLGVAPTATLKEIKQAYRRKALDTHPDKNQHLPAEQAAEAFRQVVQAFELLSDATARQRYDQTGQGRNPSSSSSSSNYRQYQNQQGYQTHTFTFHFHRHRMKDKFEVKQAMDRVLHVVSLEQLKLIMLDDDERLERHLLMCFITPGVVETWTTDEMVFPYPFAAMSSQGIWWEDLLQTMLVRFHRINDIAALFNITAAQIQENKAPVFLFAHRGQLLTDPVTTLQTRDRHSFEMWVWEQIEVRVVFINHHTHAAEIYWIHDRQAHFQMKLQPGEAREITTMLSHEFYARDARVDTRPDSPLRNKMTYDSGLASWKIIRDESPQHLVIEAQACFDLSGHCLFWAGQDQCRLNPRFMNENCAKTCQTCPEEEDDDDEDDDEEEKVDPSSKNKKSNRRRSSSTDQEEDGPESSSKGDDDETHHAHDDPDAPNYHSSSHHHDDDEL